MGNKFRENIHRWYSNRRYCRLLSTGIRNPLNFDKSLTIDKAKGTIIASFKFMYVVNRANKPIVFFYGLASENLKVGVF